MSHTIAPNSLEFFDGSYTLWKISMRVYLNSLGAWHFVEKGWNRPHVPYVIWSKDERAASISNDEALNSIFHSLSTEEFNRVSRCEIAKDAWDVLETTHKGTEIVKSSKVQMLISKFEEIKMQEHETFDEFYSKLSNIRNSTINLGKKVSNAKTVRKILRSLPKRFCPKVMAHETMGIATMKFEELVGALQTYELTLTPIKKSKDMALKTVKKSPNLLSYNDSMDEEELALFARKFKKMFRKGTSSNKPFGRNERPRGEVRGVAQEREEPKDPRGLQCHECSGFGHIRIHCGNIRMNNGRALQVTLSDDEETHEEGNFLAFITNSPLVEMLPLHLTFPLKILALTPLCVVKMFLKMM